MKCDYKYKGWLCKHERDAKSLVYNRAHTGGFEGMEGVPERLNEDFEETKKALAEIMEKAEVRHHLLGGAVLQNARVDALYLAYETRPVQISAEEIPLAV